MRSTTSGCGCSRSCGSTPMIVWKLIPLSVISSMSSGIVDGSTQVAHQCGGLLDALVRRFHDGAPHDDAVCEARDAGGMCRCGDPEPDAHGESRSLSQP